MSAKVKVSIVLVILSLVEVVILRVMVGQVSRPEQLNNQCTNNLKHQRVNLRQRLANSADKPNNRPDKYAVLICGLRESRFQVNLSLAYQVLLENGFFAENIYILEGDGGKTFLYPLDDAATKSNVKFLFDYLAKKVDGEDLLFVEVTDHGERTQLLMADPTDINRDNYSVINLVDDSLSQKEFAGYLTDICPQTGIFVFGQCYSGGFAEEIGKNKFVAVASTKATAVASADPYNLDDIFESHFMLAFRNKAVSDRNGDGRVSVEEALDYVKQNHSYTKDKKQFPFIQSDLNPETIFLD